MSATPPLQQYIRLLLGVAGFALWAYLLIDGRALTTTTTFALLTLILAAIGLGHLAPTIGWDMSDRKEDNRDRERRNDD